MKQPLNSDGKRFGPTVGNCAEPSCVATISDRRLNSHNSPVTGSATIWRGGGENPHQYTGPQADKYPDAMNPCPTCRKNINIYREIVFPSGKYF